MTRKSTLLGLRATTKYRGHTETKYFNCLARGGGKKCDQGKLNLDLWHLEMRRMSQVERRDSSQKQWDVLETASVQWVW